MIASIPPLPSTWNPATDLTTYIEDTAHAPLSAAELENFVTVMFVDDNDVAAYRDNMQVAIHQAVQSAFDLYDFPEEDRCRCCLNADKWDPVISHVMMYIGFLIDSRAMTVSWPQYKRNYLATELQAIISSARYKFTSKSLAYIIGMLCSAAQVTPWGIYMTHSLQLSLTGALRRAKNCPKWF